VPGYGSAQNHSKIIDSLNDKFVTQDSSRSSSHLDSFQAKRGATLMDFSLHSCSQSGTSDSSEGFSLLGSFQTVRGATLMYFSLHSCSQSETSSKE